MDSLPLSHVLLISYDNISFSLSALGNLEELNMLLKKQIALNSQSANSEGFNPELIVQMANEIRNLKTQLDNVSLRYDKATYSILQDFLTVLSILNFHFVSLSNLVNLSSPYYQQQILYP
jgi:hypothetical protein